MKERIEQLLHDAEQKIRDARSEQACRRCAPTFWASRAV